MRPIDVRHLGRDRVICCWDVDGVLVDPGPESALEHLLEALGGERPSALLLTHIHFDHAGASGALVRRWPDLPVYVHEVGAPHLVSPERLVASAARLYGGEDGLRRLWGEVIPVPERNLHVLRGGETLLDGAFQVAYTPGHAAHHVSYLHEPSGHAFVGDVAGVRVPPAGFTIAPTPPPDIDVEAWERSLDTLAEWAPEALCLTHFGRVDDVEGQLEAVREALREQVRLATELDCDAFQAAMRERAEAATDPETARAYLEAAPTAHLWMGIDRWLRKQAEARA